MSEQLVSPVVSMGQLKETIKTLCCCCISADSNTGLE